MRGEWSRSLHHARLHGLAQGERVGEGQLLQNALAAADRERTATAITLVRDAHGRLVGQTAKRSIHGPQKRSGTTTTGTGTGTRAGTRGSVATAPGKPRPLSATNLRQLDKQHYARQASEARFNVQAIVEDSMDARRARR